MRAGRAVAAAAAALQEGQFGGAVVLLLWVVQPARACAHVSERSLATVLLTPRSALEALSAPSSVFLSGGEKRK